MDKVSSLCSSSFQRQNVFEFAASYQVHTVLQIFWIELCRLLGNGFIEEEEEEEEGKKKVYSEALTIETQYKKSCSQAISQTV